VRVFGFTSQDFVVRISDREFWTELLKLEKVPPDRWEEMLQTIDKSEREPREKTEERLGKLAGPVFEIFEKGGESVKLNNIMENLRLRAPKWKKRSRPYARSRFIWSSRRKNSAEMPLP